MNFKNLLDEVLARGERLKDEVLEELLKSRTLQEVVANKNFIRAVSKVIESKDEVKKVIGKQVKSVFSLMDVPTKSEIAKISNQLIKIENVINKLGERAVPIHSLKKTQRQVKKAAKVAEKKLVSVAVRKRRTAGRRRR